MHARTHTHTQTHAHLLQFTVLSLACNSRVWGRGTGEEGADGGSQPRVGVCVCTPRSGVCVCELWTRVRVSVWMPVLLSLLYHHLHLLLRLRRLQLGSLWWSSLLIVTLVMIVVLVILLKWWWCRVSLTQSIFGSLKYLAQNSILNKIH